MLHFWWMRASKNSFGEPIVYLAIIALLLGWRVWRRYAVKSPLPASR